jgi:hypothetical protein
VADVALVVEVAFDAVDGAKSTGCALVTGMVILIQGLELRGGVYTPGMQRSVK